MNHLYEIPWNQDLYIASFDIQNMYTNIPTDQLPHIINTLSNHNNIDPRLRLELLQLCNVVLTQNYFTFLSSTYLQNGGLAMGAPISSIFSEIYLQFLEGTQLLDILIRHKILGYFLYVDDIFVIYNASTTSTQTVVDQFNDTSSKLSFTIGNGE